VAKFKVVASQGQGEVEIGVYASLRAAVTLANSISPDEMSVGIRGPNGKLIKPALWVKENERAEV
jgi:glucose/arabinose dehydrogenase